MFCGSGISGCCVCWLGLFLLLFCSGVVFGVCLFSLFFLKLSTEPGIRLSGAVCI